MEERSPSDHRIEPEFLGPLGDRPLAEQAGRSTPADLFPGASKFLSARQQKKRREQWNAVRPLVKRLLRPDEHVLYVAFAMQVPPALHCVGLGHTAYLYHQVLLVLTDQRIIETLLNLRANGPGTRIRSFPYRHVRSLKLSFRALVVVPAQGKKQSWRLRVGGDRKLLKLIAPLLQQRLLPEGSGQAAVLPLWHCPQCGAEVPAKPDSCASCRTVFRSPRMATLLSLAFPGAGLFYVGHPVLALCDFMGEVMLFAIWMAFLVDGRAGEGIGAALLLGGAFFAFTKIESIHVGHVLVARSIPETPMRRARFRKFALGGAVLSALVLAGAFPLAAMARPRLEHDLDAGNAGGAWSGSRKAADWGPYQENRRVRSQWTHAGTGARLTVFAFPQALGEGGARFHGEYAAAMRRTSLASLVDDDRVPAPFQGFRYVGEARDKSGQTIDTIAYFLYDTAGRDVHEVMIAVRQQDEKAGEDLVRDFVGHARFIDAVTPER